MKAMVFSDLITMRRSLVQLMGIMVVVSLVLAFSLETVAVVGACAAAMIPIMFLFSVAAYDETNGWESFRLAMPMSRANVVAGRYVSILAVTVCAFALGVVMAYLVLFLALALSAMGENALLSGIVVEGNPFEVIVGSAAMGSVVVMVVATVTTPVVMRFGVTRATRILPLVMVLALMALISCLGDDGLLAGMLPEGAQWLVSSDGGFLALVAGCVGASLVVYAASFAVALRVYAAREL